MGATYLHERKDFADLLRIIEEETEIVADLVEKDYWLMHVLYGLQKQGFDFKLKGGTSLSKGFNIINRFSEDIDIYIKPSQAYGINEKSNNEVRKRNELLMSKELVKKITGPTSLFAQIKSVQVHYFGPGCNKIIYKLLFGVIACIHFCKCTQFRV